MNNVVSIEQAQGAEMPSKAPKRAYKPRKAKEATPVASEQGTAPKGRKHTSNGLAVSTKQRKSIGQMMASFAAGFLPVASYVLAHHEAQASPILWVLVVASLAYSAPTLASWAKEWTKGDVKAWGFTILLEGVMTASKTEILSLTALGILVAINAHAAFVAYGRK